MFHEYKQRRNFLVIASFVLFVVRCFIIAVLCKAGGLLLDNWVGPVLILFAGIHGIQAVAGIAQVVKAIRFVETRLNALDNQ